MGETRQSKPVFHDVRGHEDRPGVGGGQVGQVSWKKFDIGSEKTNHCISGY